MTVLAHNAVVEDGVPVIIEHAETFPFAPGERECDWHDASDEEYARYLDYYNAEWDRTHASDVGGASDVDHP